MNRLKNMYWLFVVSCMSFVIFCGCERSDDFDDDFEDNEVTHEKRSQSKRKHKKLSSTKIEEPKDDLCGECSSIFGIPFDEPYDWEENAEEYSFEVVKDYPAYIHLSFKLQDPFCQMSTGTVIFNKRNKHLAMLTLEKRQKMNAMTLDEDVSKDQELFQVGVQALAEKFANGKTPQIESHSERIKCFDCVGTSGTMVVGKRGHKREIKLTNYCAYDKLTKTSNMSFLRMSLVVEDVQERKVSIERDEKKNREKISDEASVL